MAMWCWSGVFICLLALLCVTVGLPKVTAGQPKVTAGQPNVTAERPSVTGTRFSAAAGQINTMAVQSNVTAGQLSVTGGQSNVPGRPPTVTERRIRDCSDLPASNRSGIYKVWQNLSQPPVPAYCRQDPDGGKMWTVIQRRGGVIQDENNNQTRQSFFLGWDDYRNGFGDLTWEFWWGLEHLFIQLTAVQGRAYELRIDLETFGGDKAYAIYKSFLISSEEDGYMLLNASGYTGTAVDNLWSGVNSRFSTRDRDQDTWYKNCAAVTQGAWWYGHWTCGNCNLNGRYLESSRQEGFGIWWAEFKKPFESLKNVEMKIRPLPK